MKGGEKMTIKELIVILPDGATDLRLRQYEQQENPFSGIEQKMRWLCEIADTCPLDGTPDRTTTGYGDTQAEAYNDAIENWKAMRWGENDGNIICT